MLIHRDDSVPEEQLDVLEKTLAELGDIPRAADYRVWAQHVRKGRESRQLELAGKYQEALEREAEIEDLLNAHRGAIERCIFFDRFAGGTTILQRRLREKLEGKAAEEYTM